MHAQSSAWHLFCSSTEISSIVRLLILFLILLLKLAAANSSFLIYIIKEIVVRILLHVKLAHLLIEHITQFVDVLLFACRDKEAVVVHLCHPSALEVVESEILASGGSEVVGIFLHPCI